jgi:hypothetical protein
VCAALKAVDTDPGSALVKSREYMSASPGVLAGLGTSRSSAVLAACGKSNLYTLVASMECDSVSAQAWRGCATMTTCSLANRPIGGAVLGVLSERGKAGNIHDYHTPSRELMAHTLTSLTRVRVRRVSLGQR